MRTEGKKWNTVMAGILFLVSFYAFSLSCLAKEAPPENEVDFYLKEQLVQYDMEEIEKGFQGLFPDSRIDMEELFSLILEGKIGNAGRLVINGIKEGITGELSGMKEILIYILIIGIISALFSGFSDIFAGQQISQVGFYFLYLLLMAVLTRAFLFVAEIAVETIENIVLFVKLFVPAYFTAVGAASGSTTAVFYYQMMLLVAYLVESFLLAVLVPVIYSYVLLALLNGIWAEERLLLLLEFIKKGILIALKAAMGAVTGLGLVQSVITPVLDRMKLSAFKKAVSAIPGVGGVAEGVTELVLGAAVLIKNSMGVLLLMLLLAASILPLIKILAVSGIVKIGAALTGIVSDKRISGCTDRVGEGCFLMFRCVFTAAVLFFIVIGVAAYSIRS